MKKISMLVFALLMLLSLSSCKDDVKQPDNYTPITVEDLQPEKLPETTYSAKEFFVYNRKGYVLATPIDTGSCNLIDEREKYKDYPTDEDTSPMTARGLTVGSDLEALTSLYDLCFGYSVLSTSEIKSFDYYRKNGKIKNSETLTEKTDLEKFVSNNAEVYISIFFDRNFQPVNILSEEKTDGWIYQINFEIKYGTVYNVRFDLSK